MVIKGRQDHQLSNIVKLVYKVTKCHKGHQRSPDVNMIDIGLYKVKISNLYEPKFKTVVKSKLYYFYIRHVCPLFS